MDGTATLSDLYEFVPNLYSRVNNSVRLDLGFILMNRDPGMMDTLIKFRVNYRRNEEYIVSGDVANITLDAYIGFSQKALSSGSPMTSQYVYEINWGVPYGLPFNTVVIKKNI